MAGQNRGGCPANTDIPHQKKGPSVSSSRAFHGRDDHAAIGYNGAGQDQPINALRYCGPRGVMPDRFETIDTARAGLLADGVPDKARVISATWNKAAGNPLCAQFGQMVNEEPTWRALCNENLGWQGWLYLTSLKRRW